MLSVTVVGKWKRAWKARKIEGTATRRIRVDFGFRPRNTMVDWIDRKCFPAVSIPSVSSTTFTRYLLFYGSVVTSASQQVAADVFHYSVVMLSS